MPGSRKAIAILSIEGTNCDEELARAFRLLGAAPEIVHLKQFEGRDVAPEKRRRLYDYDALMVPGGFSAGDYVRAGAVLGARVKSVLGKDLAEFARAGHLVGGICNGFQVLVEMGLLPGRPRDLLGAPQAVLNTNDSAHFECRPTFCRWEGGNFRPLKDQMSKGTVLYIPSAHGEGKLMLSGEKGASLRELEENGQVLFRWVDPEGRIAGYPWNPNGSEGNVAGITNRDGNVFGLMPHPERSVSLLQYPDYTRRGASDGPGDGWRFLEALVRYTERGG
ncbi:MAG: phosphoribosylformylglycinamidine synthase I [Euryarchaeota archaeon]|nr:phosphoribosylformylglycinamidine synthase I [Euryarchaeota archaeon]MDE1837594.1 phosphoribosylformylglycinamidine synthase I [Euryarchaeota archaeon]MDE1881247.1 phosphoribosylformylglycinamidine synthase I [Euryarchaeota archaeon]MDE2045905.1 phosphoribosylformylglycinamidine synthase I [Thermoplasmata archaeon]